MLNILKEFEHTRDYIVRNMNVRGLWQVFFNIFLFITRALLFALTAYFQSCLQLPVERLTLLLWGEGGEGKRMGERGWMRAIIFLLVRKQEQQKMHVLLQQNQLLKKCSLVQRHYSALLLGQKCQKRAECGVEDFTLRSVLAMKR